MPAPVDLASVATLIVVPNVPVLDQWMDALSLSGVKAQQVLRFQGDFTRSRLERPRLRDQRLPRVVIMRKYQLQSEQVGVFHHLKKRTEDTAAPGGHRRASSSAPPVLV